MAKTSDHNNTEVAEGLTNKFEVESLAFTETCLDVVLFPLVL